MSDPTPAAPEALQLRGAPGASARLSKKAALLAVAVLATLIGVIVVNISKDKTKTPANDNTAKTELQPALNSARTLTRDIPDVLPETTPKQPPQVPQLPPAHTPADTDGSRGPSPEERARQADSAVPRFAHAQSTAIQPAFAAEMAEDSAPDAGPGENSGNPLHAVSNGLATTLSNTLAGAEQEPAAQADLNSQAQKIAFRQPTSPSAYLPSRVKRPLSPFELKTGTVIPGILISEVNSDLPGEVIAQVSQNVYDTASGSRLLIPQGARLFGRYDSHVTFGQQRALVIWERLIYPDASTLELGGMPGADQTGKDGFADRVNNHYARVFGYALLTSVLSAGYQLSQSQGTTAGNFVVPSNQQIVAAAVGQQMAELGSEIARRNMRVQPTIEIRKGYRLDVMVNKDVVFPGTYTP